jgi:hypothetical protein
MDSYELSSGKLVPNFISFWVVLSIYCSVYKVSHIFEGFKKYLYNVTLS